MRIKRPQTRAGDGLTAKTTPRKRSQALGPSSSSATTARKRPATRSPSTTVTTVKTKAKPTTSVPVASSGETGRKPSEQQKATIPIVVTKHAISRPPKKGVAIKGSNNGDRKPTTPPAALKDERLITSKELKNLDIQIAGYTEQQQHTVGSGSCTGVKASISEIVKTKSRTSSTAATQNMHKTQHQPPSSVPSTKSGTTTKQPATATTCKEDVSGLGVATTATETGRKKNESDGAGPNKKQVAAATTSSVDSVAVALVANMENTGAKTNVSTLKKLKSPNASLIINSSNKNKKRITGTGNNSKKAAAAATKQRLLIKNTKITRTSKSTTLSHTAAKLPKKNVDINLSATQPNAEMNEKIILKHNSKRTVSEILLDPTISMAPVAKLPSDTSSDSKVDDYSSENSQMPLKSASVAKAVIKKTKNSHNLKLKKTIDKAKSTAGAAAKEQKYNKQLKRPIIALATTTSSTNCFSHSESPDSSASPVLGQLVKQKKIKKSHTIIKKMVEDILEGLEMSDDISSEKNIPSIENVSMTKNEKLNVSSSTTPLEDIGKETKDVITVKDIQTMIATPIVTSDLSSTPSVEIVKIESEKCTIPDGSGTCEQPQQQCATAPNVALPVTPKKAIDDDVFVINKQQLKRASNCPKRPQQKKIVAKTNEAKSSFIGDDAANTKLEKDIFDFRESGNSSEDTCLSYLKNIKKESIIMDEKTIEKFAAKAKKCKKTKPRKKKSCASKAQLKTTPTTAKTGSTKKQKPNSDSITSSDSDDNVKVAIKKIKRASSSDSSDDDDDDASTVLDSDDTTASKSAGGTRVNKRRTAAVKNRRMKLFGFYSGPKRHRMASLNALAKVQCLYENESRTAQELGFVREPRAAPKVKVATATAAQPIPVATSVDEQPSKSTGEGKTLAAVNRNANEMLSVAASTEPEPVAASKVVSRNLRTDPGLRGPGKLWEMGNMSSMDSETAPETDESYDEVSLNLKYIGIQFKSVINNILGCILEIGKSIWLNKVYN